MKKLLLILVMVLALASATAVPGFAQGPPPGSPVGNENCEGKGLVPDGGAVSTLDVDTGDNSDDGDDIRTLTVTIDTPGHTSSEIITYEDNDGSASLTCGDTIISVV